MIELSLNEYHGPKKMLPKVKKKMRDCKPGWRKNSLRIDSRTVSGTDSSTEWSTDKPGKLSWRFTRVWMYTIAKAFFSISGKIRFCKYPLSAASADSPFNMFAAINLFCMEIRSRNIMLSLWCGRVVRTGKILADNAEDRTALFVRSLYLDHLWILQEEFICSKWRNRESILRASHFFFLFLFFNLRFLWWLGGKRKRRYGALYREHHIRVFRTIHEQFILARRWGFKKNLRTLKEELWLLIIADKDHKIIQRAEDDQCFSDNKKKKGKIYYQIPKQWQIGRTMLLWEQLNKKGFKLNEKFEEKLCLWMTWCGAMRAHYGSANKDNQPYSNSLN